jgi:MutL-like protein
MTSIPTPTIESIIAADVGSTMTKAVLIDLVEGEYRIIANAEFPTTLEPPYSDVSLAVLQCIGRLEEIVSRQLLDEKGTLMLPERSDGNGVDAFVATASAAEPLRVAIAGLIRDLSVESARKATYATYAQTETLMSLDSQTGQGERWDLPARIAALHRQVPSVIILTGGSDQGASKPLLDAAYAVATACATWPDAAKPDVIFAGNAAARSRIAEMIGDGARLRVVDNVRPTSQIESLEGIENELELLFLERRLNRLPGIGKLAAVSSKTIAATSAAFGAGVRALSTHFELNTLGVDIGGATTTMAVSDGGKFFRVQRSDIGVSYNIESVARLVGIDNILRWLPIVISEEEAWDYLTNKTLRPFTLPETRKELWLEQAAAREAMRLTLDELAQRWRPERKRAAANQLPTIDLIVGAGGILTHAPHSGQAVLLLLDALQPVSVVNLALDSGGLMPQLSLIASVQPQAAAQLAAREGISALGTAICPIGSARPGDVVVSYSMTYHEGDGSTIGGEVKAGEIEVLPLAPTQKARLELRPARNIDLGQGRGRPGTTIAEGGTVGLVIDARGRPLVLPGDPEARAELNQQWLYNVGA